LSTNNGGQIWDQYQYRDIWDPSNSFDLNSISFTNSNNGSIVGDDFTILTTDDGGQTWKDFNGDVKKIGQIESEENYNLNCIFFIDENEGWIVGDNGTIYYSENGSGGFVAVESDTKPDDFMLAQNYPNPFNPSTTFEFSVPFESNITIEIYNILGQLVCKVTSTSVQKGTHAFKWNGMDNYGITQNSGVYLYVVKNGDFQQTKKMLLVR